MPTNRKFSLSDSEVITNPVSFNLGQFRNLKHFYIHHVQKFLKREFPRTVFYHRFVELWQESLGPVVCLLKMFCLGKCTGATYIDSAPLRVCHIKREKQHETFKGLATRGHCSIGWFFGFKLNIIINDRGWVLTFMFTTANSDDRNPLENKRFHQKVFGKVPGDKG